MNRAGPSVKLRWLSLSMLKGSYLTSSLKVRIYTDSSTADQLLCRAYRKEKQEANCLQCAVVFIVRK